MTSRHTNKAVLSRSATSLLECAGRLREHETWDNDERYRKYIEEEIQKETGDILDWIINRSSPASLAILKGHIRKACGDLGLQVIDAETDPPSVGENVTRLVPRPDPDHRPLAVNTDDRTADDTLPRDYAGNAVGFR